MEQTDKKLKLVFISTAIPEESMKHAQVVIVTGKTWHIIAPAPYRAHVDGSMEMPEMRCPIVDVSAFSTDYQDEKMAQIVKATTDAQAGVINLAGLLTGLEALGATVTRPAPLSASQTFPQISAEERRSI
jgi:hypothetical protein